METTALNIPVGLRYSVQPQLRGYHPINDGQESSSRLIWFIVVCFVYLFITTAGMAAFGYINAGSMALLVPIGCFLCWIWEGFNLKSDCGCLRKICDCRDAEIHTPEQPSPSQLLLQSPTLQDPVPEPPTLQDPVPEP